jgi:hypothetical protein
LEEKRRESDKTIALLMQKLEDHIQSSNDYRKDQADRTKCIKETVDVFSRKYTPILDELISSRKFWNDIKDKSIEKSATGIIWAALGAIGYGLWMAIKVQLKII